MRFYGLLPVLTGTACLLATGAYAQETTGQVPGTIDALIAGAVGGALFNRQYDGSSYSDQYRGVSLEGSASAEYNLTSGLGFQGDLVGGYQKHQSSDDSLYSSHTTKFDAAGHLFYRDAESYLIGAFIQGGTSFNQIDNGLDSGTNLDRFYGGVEAQAFLGDLTLYGQLAAQRAQLREDTDNHAQGWVANVEARYFLQPNFKIEAHAGYDTSTYADASDIREVWNAGVGAEYRFDATPLSLFAKYDFVNFNYVGDETRQSDRFLVGLKVNFGTDTLEQRDRTGASLKPITSYEEYGVGKLAF